MKNPTDEQDELRPHSYDGIQEYDKKLPNWWLFTLYITIVYAIGYWAWNHTYEMSPPPGEALTAQMQENAKMAARNATELTDKALWEMSRDPKLVDAGKTTFLTMCAACHLPDLSGQVGPNLKDTTWVQSGKPLDLVKLVTDGVPAKGMPTWGPILGRQKITESVAFILSYHKEGEPVTIAPWVPRGVPVPPAPTAASAPSP
jgi:cytochrome c oxidase cbb3-type subunit 3